MYVRKKIKWVMQVSEVCTVPDYFTKVNVRNDIEWNLVRSYIVNYWWV